MDEKFVDEVFADLGLRLIGFQICMLVTFKVPDELLDLFVGFVECSLHSSSIV
jgi:hypothetical protein